jgi:hypothetical protein
LCWIVGISYTTCFIYPVAVCSSVLPVIQQSLFSILFSPQFIEFFVTVLAN